MGSKGQIATFSEHCHVAYQIKGNQVCSNMVANILPADPPMPPPPPPPQEHLHQLLQTVSPPKMLAIPLCLDALFVHFKQSANKTSPRCQSKKLNCATQIQLLKQWVACSNMMEIGPDIRSCVKLVGCLKTVHS